MNNKEVKDAEKNEVGPESEKKCLYAPPEKIDMWLRLNPLLQTVILFLTMLGAIFIGLQQNSINEKLLNLNFMPSVEVFYSNKKINIKNNGKTNIYLNGTQFNGGVVSKDGRGRLITPAGSYYLNFDHIIPQLETTLSEKNVFNIPFNIFIKTENKENYLVQNLLHIRKVKKGFEISSQTVATIKEE